MDKQYSTLILFKGLLILFPIFFLGACNNFERDQHIEVTVHEVSEKNENGLYETTEYKKINSITTIEKEKNLLITDTKAIEDIYDKESKYKKTEIIHTKITADPLLKTEKIVENRKEVLQNPSTILIPDNKLKESPLDNLSNKKEKEVKKHILSFIEQL